MGKTDIEWTGRALGVRKGTAKRLGLSFESYVAMLGAGQKWCVGCKEWHHERAFGADKTRGDGLACTCDEARNARARARYTTKPRRSRLGSHLVASRDGDRLQARARVNHAITTGRLPRPNALPCFDCGHAWESGERRHEYDHYLGYAARHQYDVQAVCTSCHATREAERRAAATWIEVSP